MVAAAYASEPNGHPGTRRWESKAFKLAATSALRRRIVSDPIPHLKVAAAVWSNAAAIDITVEETGPDPANLRAALDGANLVTIASEPEDLEFFPAHEGSAPAYTRLFFNRRGQIIEADVILNPFVQFSVDGTPGSFDLQSVLIHELGHVAGLPHSASRSATMFGRISPNREGIPSDHEARALTAADISAIRDLYGPRSAESDCCVALFPTIAKAVPFVIWAEEPATGRLVAVSESRKGEPASLGGLQSGRYRILSQPVSANRGSSVQLAERRFDMVGEIGSKPWGPVSDLNIRLIGLNAQLGELPVRLERGRNYQIFLGGSGLDPRSVRFGSGSPQVTVSDGTAFSVDFGGAISAVAMNISVGREAAPGEYSIYAESGAIRRYLLGAISVE